VVVSCIADGRDGLECWSCGVMGGEPLRRVESGQRRARAWFLGCRFLPALHYSHTPSFQFSCCHCARKQIRLLTYGRFDTIFFGKMKMDSSSFFAPVCKGFMMFHFCKKTGGFGNISLFAQNFILDGFARRVRGGEGWGKRTGAAIRNDAIKKSEI
jgi:hypothetical protein